MSIQPRLNELDGNSLYLISESTPFLSNRRNIIGLIPGIIQVLVLLTTFACVSTPINKADDGLPPYESISYQIAVGNPQKALEEYDKAIKKGKENLDAKILHVRLLLTAGKREDASAELNEILRIAPDNVEALFTRSFIFMLAGNKKEQTSTLEKIIRIDKTYAPAFAYLGELALVDNKADIAMEHFANALANDPANFVALNGMGNALMRTKQYKKAIESFDKSIAIDPKYSFAYTDRAKAKSLGGDTNGAILDLTTAIGLVPDDYYSFIDRGKLYLDQGKTAEAESDFSAASKIDPEFFLAYVFLGGIYYDAKDYNKAREAYEKAALKKPQYYFVYEPIGAIYYMQENWLEATKAFSTAYKYMNDEHSYALLTALAYKKAGKNKDAQEYISSQMNNIPQDSWYFDVARFYYNPGNDIYAIQRADKEKSPVIKKRILFYIGAQYLITGKLRDTAITYLLDAENMERKDLIECTLASWELGKLQKKAK